MDLATRWNSATMIEYSSPIFKFLSIFYNIKKMYRKALITCLFLCISITPKTFYDFLQEAYTVVVLVFANIHYCTSINVNMGLVTYCFKDLQ